MPAHAGIQDYRRWKGAKPGFRPSPERQKKNEAEGSSIKVASKILVRSVLLALIVSTLGCSTPISTREQGGLIGAGLGAGTGAIIGSTVGHAAVGALVGGPVGLIAGALIGDHLMGMERTRQDQSIQSDQNRQEIERLRRENERLRQERIER